jgi:hypothetical protein
MNDRAWDDQVEQFLDLRTWDESAGYGSDKGCLCPRCMGNNGQPEELRGNMLCRFCGQLFSWTKYKMPPLGWNWSTLAPVKKPKDA